MPESLTARGSTAAPRWLKLLRRLAVLALPMLAGASLWGQAAPTYQIQSAVPASVAAGAAGATIALTGTLPEFATGAYQVCFYTGSGSTPR